MTIASGMRPRRLRVPTALQDGGTGARTAQEAVAALGVPSLDGDNTFTGTNTFDGRLLVETVQAISDLTLLTTDVVTLTGGTGSAALDLTGLSATRTITFPDASGTLALTSDITGGSGSPAFPVGSVFIAVVSTDPATLLGYGTWAAFAAGRVLVGLDSGDANFDTVEETGGAKTVASSAQTFAGTALGTHQHELPLHGGTTPRITAGYGTGSSIAGTRSLTNAAQTTAQAVLLDKATSAGTPAGTNTPGAATSVVQPYIVVYMWKRTA